MDVKVHKQEHRMVYYPYELYSRLTVGTDGEEVRCFNYGIGDTVPGTERVATLIDTNLPPKRRCTEHLEGTELSWHITLPTTSLDLAEIQKLMDRGRWELHTGGELPFYQGLFCTTALSGMNVVRAYPIMLRECLKLTTVYEGKSLLESDHFYVAVTPPKLAIPIDVVFRIGCSRVRGIC